jgi:hypothetical protein
MALLLAFVFIVLGAAVLALGGVWRVFPEGWQAVGIILTVMGVVMSLPGFVQRLIGRAKLIVEFDRIVEQEERSLAIFVKNPQLGDASTGKKSIWRRLGVKRETIESLIVSFRIYEVGTEKVVIPIMHARIYSDADASEQGSWRVTVPPTLSFETSVMVAMWNESKKAAVVPGDRLRGVVELPKGLYRIEAVFVVDGEAQKRLMQFVVGDTGDSLNWVKKVAGPGDSES